ncbi:HlyD family secretion protein [Novosphingobium sp. FKTRR1]|uniref:HlyD family secretion protein n=1 Tax=Novosphingobium sp. FKTRR1 TaxID=2879118 RepID=UPI001CF01389|nr:HlyD family secretion protein [Novosphingobium sp. FKTRR1]
MAQDAPDTAHRTETANDEAPAARRRIGRGTLAAGVALLVAGAGAVWILAEPASQSTDDAYLAADSTTVAPRVKGFVSQVLVAENQSVRAGQPLLRIDAEEFSARHAAAQADLANARAAVAAAQAALARQGSEEAVAAAQITAAATTIRAGEASATNADADNRRYAALVSTGAVAERDAQGYRTAAIGAQQGLARARAELDVARRQAAVTLARRADLRAALESAQAGEARAHAALDLAGQDLRHTLIAAPVDGVVANRQLRVGDYVQPGTRALTLVPLGGIYVTANFKETQTRHMRPGQHATVRVDALGSTTLTGQVDSLAPGSASTFALLPFEPGTGNFTKIVQRVPVRIRLDRGQPGLTALRPGLSVTATVNVSKQEH